MSIVIKKFTNTCGSFATIRLDKGSTRYRLTMYDSYNVMFCNHTYATYKAAYNYMQKYCNNSMIEK